MAAEVARDVAVGVAAVVDVLGVVVVDVVAVVVAGIRTHQTAGVVAAVVDFETGTGLEIGSFGFVGYFVDDDDGAVVGDAFRRHFYSSCQPRSLRSRKLSSCSPAMVRWSSSPIANRRLVRRRGAWCVFLPAAQERYRRCSQLAAFPGDRGPRT